MTYEEAKPFLKEGMAVRVVSLAADNSNYAPERKGRIGTLTDWVEDCNKWRLRLEGSEPTDCFFDKDDEKLEILTNPDGSKWVHPDEFKVGDRVKIIECQARASFHIGKTGVIEKLTPAVCIVVCPGEVKCNALKCELVQEEQNLIIHCPTKELWERVAEKFATDNDPFEKAHAEAWWEDCPYVLNFDNDGTKDDWDFITKEELRGRVFISAEEYLGEEKDRFQIAGKVLDEIAKETFGPGKIMMNQVLDNAALAAHPLYYYGDWKYGTTPPPLLTKRKDTKFMSLVKTLKSKLSADDRTLHRHNYIDGKGNRSRCFEDELKAVAIERLVDEEDTPEFRTKLAAALNKEKEVEEEDCN